MLPMFVKLKYKAYFLSMHKLVFKYKRFFYIAVSAIFGFKNFDSKEGSTNVS